MVTTQQQTKIDSKFGDPTNGSEIAGIDGADCCENISGGHAG